MRPAPESSAPLAKGLRAKLTGDAWDAFHRCPGTSSAGSVEAWPRRGGMAGIKRRFSKRARKASIEIEIRQETRLGNTRTSHDTARVDDGSGSLRDVVSVGLWDWRRAPLRLVQDVRPTICATSKVYPEGLSAASVSPGRDPSVFSVGGVAVDCETGAGVTGDNTIAFLKVGGVYGFTGGIPIAWWLHKSCGAPRRRAEGSVRRLDFPGMSKCFHTLLARIFLFPSLSAIGALPPSGDASWRAIE